MSDTFNIADGSIAAQRVVIARERPDSGDAAVQLFAALLSLAIVTLAVWWTFATFFPELGMTYWGLVLPVWAFRLLISPKREPRPMVDRR